MMSTSKLTLVAAMAQQRVIGIENRMPWHLAEDFKHFKAVTMGKPVLMGRKTFESIGRPLPGRRNIVITRNRDWQAEGIEVAYSLDEAIALAGAVEEACIIGGADLYRQAIVHPQADKLILTEIDLEVAGDAFFPQVDPAVWQEAGRDEHVRESDGLRYAFVEYRRK
jgi:dihydrofolate reductase